MALNVENSSNYVMPGGDAPTQDVSTNEQSVFIQFADSNGDETGTPIFVPCNSSVSALTEILTTFRDKVSNYMHLNPTFRTKMNPMCTNSSLEKPKFLTIWLLP